MSYTFKKVNWEPCVLINNTSIVTEYGDIVRKGLVQVVVQVVVRKQPKVSVIKTADGREILTKSIFYVDAQLEPNALSIKKMDKLDGETIEDVYVMCDLMNKPKMVRFITT